MFDWKDFLIQVSQSSFLEWAAVLTSIVYVILAARNNIFCWFFAIVSSAIYTYICFTFQLYIESGLQFFYLAMGVIGLLLWKKSNDTGGLITTWKLSQHIINISVSGIGTIVLGYVFSQYTDQATPYIDAFTTCYSLAATYMVTKRVLENWIYWIIIDSVSIYLYAGRDLYLTSVLFIIFTVLAIIGYISWLNKYNVQLNG